MKNFKPILLNVYDNFYEKLLNDKNFSLLFKGKDVNEIKKKQIDNLLYTFSLFEKKDTQKLKKIYSNLGEFHFKLGVPYIDYIEQINYLELLIIKDLFKNIKERKVDYQIGDKIFNKIENFFVFVKNFSSLGYLKIIVEKEKDLITNLLSERSIDNIETLNKFLSGHNKIKQELLLFIIEEKDIINYVPIEKCKITNFLNSVKKKSNFEISKIEDLHKKFHEILEKLIELKEDKKYSQLIIEYHEFIKTHFLLSLSIITFLTSIEMENLKRDSLTKLLTRSTMMKIFVNIKNLATLANSHLGIAFIDIDDFKYINDKYGHLIGDQVLVKIANLLKKKVRGNDYIFRYGGEEFLILFSSIDGFDIFYKKLEEIRKSINKIKIKTGNTDEFNISVSIGGLYVKNTKENINKLIEKADMLMYKAKKTGKNKVFVEIYD